MKIYCNDLSVFEVSERRELERLLMRVRLGQHELVLDDPQGFFVTAFFDQAVAPASRLEVQELLERQDPALADRNADPVARFPGPRAELVPIAIRERTCRRDGGHPVWEIDATTAGAWSEAPLRLLLENDSDWNLIAAAARVYQRPKVIDARENKFLYPDQRGGKTEVEKAVRFCGREERIFLMIDSDRETEDGPVPKCQKRIRRLAQSRPNVLPFILAKREVENYVPNPVWQHCVARKWFEVKKHRAWRSLSDVEKDFADMEDYFRDAKKHVPMLCDAELVPDAATLESRSGSYELVDLLDQLEAWL